MKFGWINGAAYSQGVLTLEAWLKKKRFDGNTWHEEEIFHVTFDKIWNVLKLRLYENKFLNRNWTKKNKCMLQEQMNRKQAIHKLQYILKRNEWTLQVVDILGVKNKTGICLERKRAKMNK